MRNSKKIANLKELVNHYRSGNITEEEITAIEKINRMPIEELVAKAEDAISLYSHCLGMMTITDLKKWRKQEQSISEEEKQLYAAANKCTYEQFVEAAHDYLDKYERGRMEDRMRQQVKQMDAERERLQKLVDEGKATTEDGKSFFVPSENATYIIC